MAEKIVVVEDDKDIQYLLQNSLTKAGYDVTVISDGNSLATQQTERADLYLLDVNLPGINGLDLCKQLKLNNLTRNTPVIMLSAFPGLKNVAPKYFADDSMEKPFNFATLMSMITKHLRKAVSKTPTETLTDASDVTSKDQPTAAF
ncbi:MAG TPA: response regulator transcription factor [Chryseosolibacter sp.]|nr:response regulator transcription factor [Chryseosolibacter sp.]